MGSSPGVGTTITFVDPEERTSFNLLVLWNNLEFIVKGAWDLVTVCNGLMAILTMWPKTYSGGGSEMYIVQGCSVCKITYMGATTEQSIG